MCCYFDEYVFAIITDIIFHQAQSDAQHAALCYQRAISEHRSAKTMVIRAEETLIKQNSTYRQFDLAWQEMLNQATIKVNNFLFIFIKSIYENFQ